MSELNTGRKTANLPTPKEVFFRYLPYFPWLLLSIIVFLTGAYIKLRYTTPVFSVNGKILVNDNNPYGKTSEKFSNIFMMSDDDQNLNNEIEIIKSRSMASRVIRTLGLQQQYSIKGNIRTSEAHPEDFPFEWIIEQIKDSSKPFSATITPVSNNQFKINEKSLVHNFAESVESGGVRFRLIPLQKDAAMNLSYQYIITWMPEEKVAAAMSGSIGVTRSEGASVLNLSYPVENRLLGIDIVNGYMKEYQLSSLEGKKVIAYNTSVFINEQLDTLQRELGGVEKNLQVFREENEVFDAEGQSSLFFGTLADINKLLTEEEVRLKIVDYLLRYLSEDINNTKIVPSNLGIEDASLTEQVLAYNKLQLDRESLLKTTTPENLLVKRIDVALAQTRGDIIQNLRNIRVAHVLTIKDLNDKRSSANASIRSIPRKDRALLEVKRRQTILQELYSFLLQKKIETAISSASTISDITILEPASVRNIPLSPNKKGTYILAFIIGTVIPIGILLLREYMNDKIQSKQDITRVTDAPILGELGHVEDATTLVVKENDRSYIAEQFRIIRSNMQYLLPKDENPVILVTSSFSGEGKSFVSTNLGAVMALSGKKTLIMEMDIRKPKILKGLGMQERRGFSNYVIGDIEVDELLYQVPGVENLFVLPCGPIPPNPSEMLLDPKVGKLMQLLKDRFEVIIIDSAPVGLVSDSISLGAFANTSVYLVRHNYTYKKQIDLVDNIYKQKKLPAISIIINDIKVKGGYGSYYGYGSYGYGSYGYGIGSLENNAYFNGGVEKRSLLKRLFAKRKK